MAKAKKPKFNRQISKPYTKIPKKATPRPSAGKTTKTAKSHPPSAPTIPFLATDRILLLGEGDFSFAHSLLATHDCENIIATSYDTQAEVARKYPQALVNVEALESRESCKVLYGVDARKLGKKGTSDGGGKDVKKGGFDKVVFNFPHVGGLTKDVNRQVRHNQELLVGFFKTALPCLIDRGSIIVTIFEGEPYDLWNIRDLARHVGLKVGRSFKFQARAYPGYKHSRTLGNIEGGGGWKGEDRPARTYLFEANDGRAEQIPKRKAKSSDEDSEHDK